VLLCTSRKTQLIFQNQNLTLMRAINTKIDGSFM
jgi:hypothetical protein